MFDYPVRIRMDGGDFVVEVRDLPEVVTSGDTHDQALELAADAIDVAVSARMEREIDLPVPSAPEQGEVLVGPPAPLAAKAEVYAAWKRAGIRKTELARRLGKDEREVRRILDPGHGTKLDQLDAVARALGGRLTVGWKAA